MKIRQASKIIRTLAYSNRPVREDRYEQANRKMDSYVGRGMRRARKEVAKRVK